MFGEGRVIVGDCVIAHQREEIRQDLHISARGLSSELADAIRFKDDVAEALTEYARA